MQTEKLQRAIGAIHVRFCDQALRRADGLPPRQPWPTGQLRADRLCGTGGLPSGRISVVEGSARLAATDARRRWTPHWSGCAPGWGFPPLPCRSRALYGLRPE